MKISPYVWILFALVFMAGIKTTKNIPVVDFSGIKPLLEKENDTTYVINFWASWCKPCLEEMPDFELIHKNFLNQKVKVYLISLDLPSQIDSRLIPYLKENDITAPVILLDDPDQNTWINAVDSSWNGSIPATLIYGPGGRSLEERKLNYEEIKTFINKYK